MYCGNVPRLFIFNNRNSSFIKTRGKHLLQNGAHENRHWGKFFELYSFFMRSITPAIKNNGLSKGLKTVYGQSSVIQCLRQEFLKIPLCLKKHSVHIVRTCTQQCEYVVAHRIRRGQQIFSLYTKLWDEVALKELAFRMRQQLSRKGKEILWGAVLIGSTYQWEKISDDEIHSCMDEMDQIHWLRENTVTCSNCHQRQIIDIELPSIKYCRCPGSNPTGNKQCDCSEWVPFIERPDLIVWRREEKNHLYAYKVYGRYDDVTAEDFFRVQIDTDYRKEWDPTAVQLEVLESDPNSNSDVIYWVMEWPRMFSNRDYVFNRRYEINKDKKVLVLVNKGMEHPKCPVDKKNYRVTDYYSCMVIKPLSDISEPGIEFSLTYFDNPGVSIPSAITSWVAKSGLPDFLGKLRRAARELAYRRSMEESSPGVEMLPDVSINGQSEQPTTDISEEQQEPTLDITTKPVSELIPTNIQDIEYEKKSKPYTSQEDKLSDLLEIFSGSNSSEKSESDISTKEEVSNQTSPGEQDKNNENETSEEEPKSQEDPSKPSLNSNSFPHQDPPDVSYLQFHGANLFT